MERHERNNDLARLQTGRRTSCCSYEGIDLYQCAERGAPEEFTATEGLACEGSIASPRQGTTSCTRTGKEIGGKLGRTILKETGKNCVPSLTRPLNNPAKAKK